MNETHTAVIVGIFDFGWDHIIVYGSYIFEVALGDWPIAILYPIAMDKAKKTITNAKIYLLCNNI